MLSWFMASSSATGPQPAQRRSRHYSPEDDNYDPTKPEYVQSATRREVEEFGRRVLDQQILRLHDMLSKRHGLVPQVAMHYANVLDELHAERLSLEEEPCEEECPPEEDGQPEYAGRPTILESGFRARGRSCSAWNLELEGSCKSDGSLWSDESTEAPGAGAAAGAAAKEAARKATSSTAASDRDWERPEDRSPAAPSRHWPAQADDLALNMEFDCNRSLAKALLSGVYGKCSGARPLAAASNASVAEECRATGKSEASSPTCCVQEERKVGRVSKQSSSRGHLAAWSPTVGCCGCWEVFTVFVSAHRRRPA